MDMDRAAGNVYECRPKNKKIRAIVVVYGKLYDD